MSQNELKTMIVKPSKVKVGPLLSKLPRLTVTARAAPNRKAAESVNAAYGITTAKKLTEAFAVKSNLTKG